MRYSLFFIVFISFFITGCAKKVYVLHEGFIINEEKTKSIEVFYFYDNFGMSEQINAYTICPGGIGGIEYDRSLFDSVISIVTVNIITPRRVTFYCMS